MSELLQTAVLKQFTCIGDRCVDTCCKGWSMQMDERTYARYQQEAPELVDAVEASVEAPLIMRKNSTGVCAKLENGLCAIHKRYGDGFLGDACYFYPRITRALGEQPLMTAALSCPEIARIALSQDHLVAWQPHQVERMPQSVKQYMPADMTPADALAVHQRFVEAAGDPTLTAEQAFLRIASVARFLDRIPSSSWAAAIPTYFKTAEALLPPAQIDGRDPFHLLQALYGLIIASQKPMSERLQRTVGDMQSTLQAMIDPISLQLVIQETSAAAYQRALTIWKAEAADFCAPILRRWLQMQLSMSLFPFSGLGSNLESRVTIIGVRLATLKLAFICGYAMNKIALSQDEVVRVVQSLSRALDHLASPDFSLQIYAETGWTQESRMRGLLE
ncbi:MAG: flagellin lysine-N-methylase [Rickettsiales bacterium]|nr:flagellin lysine-N-methylase [Rickettsiales bacterium]